MQVFDKNTIRELKKYLYSSSCVHDAVITNIQYKDDDIIVEAYNPIENKRIRWLFHDVETVVVLKGHWFGDSKTIIDLTVEDNLSFLNSIIQHNEASKAGAANDLYLVFEQLSGHECHIVTKELTMEITEA